MRAAFASRYTWRTSSRVGARTSAPGPSARRAPRDGGAASSPARSRCMTGSRKASVYPLPVLAAKAALLPSSSRGTANCWIAVGLTWPSLLRAVSASGSRPILAHMADRQAEHRRDVGSVRSDRRDVVHSFHSSTRQGQAAHTARFPCECDRTSATASAGCSPSLTPCDHPPTLQSPRASSRSTRLNAWRSGSGSTGRQSTAVASSSEARRSRTQSPRSTVSAPGCQRAVVRTRRTRMRGSPKARATAAAVLDSECAVAIAAADEAEALSVAAGLARRAAASDPQEALRRAARLRERRRTLCSRGCSGNPSATSVAPALAPAGATTSAPRPAPSPSPRATATARDRDLRPSLRYTVLNQVRSTEAAGSRRTHRTRCSRARRPSCTRWLRRPRRARRVAERRPGRSSAVR